MGHFITLSRKFRMERDFEFMILLFIVITWHNVFFLIL